MSNTAIEKRKEDRIEKREGGAPVAGAPERLEQATFFTPLVDVLETGDAYVFQADLPGVKPGDVDVSYENGVLTIAGRVWPRRQADQDYVWQEYGVGHFYRQFSLGEGTDPDAIRAELRNGVLELHVPKSESARSRRIPVKGG